MTRRNLLRHCYLASLSQVGLITGAHAAQTWPIEARSFEAALAAIGGHPLDSSEIALDLPRHIENGRSVPVAIKTSLAGTTDLYILADVNPEPLAIRCRLPSGTAAELSTRIKLAESGRVYGVVRSQDALFWTAREARVTQGGCA